MLHESQPQEPAFSAGKLWPVAAGSLVAILGLGYGLRGGTQDRDIIANQHSLSISVNQLQKQMKDLSERLSALNALQQKTALVIEPERPEPQPPPAPRARPVAARRAAATPTTRAKPTDDPRWKDLQQQLAAQSERLSSTQQELERARQDLESRLGTTREDLGGSIARTNEELAELRKRGEREYHEFNLAKSKQFQRTGPVSLALRKADTKRKRYDLDLFIDDVKLEKRNVNLYEPIYIRTSAQPIELIVNEVTKDRVKGYVSIPKAQQARR